MRIRTVKPEFWTSFTIAKLSRDAKLTLIGLLNYADDEGRGKDDARLVHAALFALDDGASLDDVEGWLREIADQGLILRYAVDGKRYFQILSWAEHQSISRPSPSKLPEPSEQTQGTLMESSVNTPRRNREQGTGNREQGKDIAMRDRDELFETVAEVCNIDWHNLTGSARGSLNKSVAQLRGVSADPDEVRRRAALWPYDVPLTPPGLAKHWPALAEVKPVASASSRRLSAIADELERQGR